MSTRTFTDDEQASIKHALLHLEANKIPGYGGWYRGNLTEFVERHGKAIALLRSLLPPSAKEGRSGR